ncbi:MAG: cytochrome c [Acidobacteriota bacterium]
MRRTRALSAVALALAALLVCPNDASARRGKKKKSAAKTRVVVAAPRFDPHLPLLGTKLAEFPPGPAKALADQACLACHSVDLVAQQRLTEKQWGAEVTKMAGWGADLPADRREELIGYLVKNFGPDAGPWEPVVTRPAGR